MKATRFGISAAVVMVVCVAARADDVFYRVPFSDLQIVEGAFPKRDDAKPVRWEMYGVVLARAVLDGEGEAYVTGSGTGGGDWGGEGGAGADMLVVRAPAGAPVAGMLFVPKPDASGAVPVKFTIAEKQASPEARRLFFETKEAHYTRLQFGGTPGSAWFRRQATEAHRQLGNDDHPEANRRRPWQAQGDMEDTYDLFSGGQALSENLQLNRDLPAARTRGNQPADAPETPVAVSSIEGITVQAMDWKAALGAAKPALDPLAAAIPADQHAVFFPTFDALMTMADETSGKGLPVFRSIEGRSEDGRLVDRYERQLCLRPSALTRLLGGKVVKSVAITGSDPYFPTGTDVAVLFQAADGKALGELLTAQARASATSGGAAEKAGDVGAVHYTSFTTMDRSICSCVAAIGDNVVVTNSIQQLRRLSEVAAGTSPAIASLPEYQFFRVRYPAGAEAETGLVFLSDAAIRRWCGPEWRIGASRRVRAGAILADVTAAHMDDLTRGLKDSLSVESDTPMRSIGELTIGPDGVRSSVYGSMHFLTPIAELGIKEVAPDEADSYRQWRDTYQRNWRWGFDPIAISFSLRPERISADLSVMPLIVASEYRTFVEFGRGAAIGPDAGDPHDTVAHLAVAVNVESAGVRQASGMAQSFALGKEMDPLGWLGKSVAVYADPDPLWNDLAKASERDTYMEKNAYRLPIGLNAEVGSALKLTAFLAAMRAFVDQSSTGMVAWESRKHKDQEYIRAGLTEKAKAQGAGDDFDKMAVFYAATPKALIVSLNEDVLKRALDRQTERADAKVKPEARPHPWLGSNLCVQLSRSGLDLINHGLAGSRNAMQRASWSNLPILNEWKRRYPDQDPVRLHEARWGVRLVDPAGGTYVWNGEFKTMESTTYGHPGQQKQGPEGLGPINSITSVNAGISFEDKGLRAKTVIEREPAKR